MFQHICLTSLWPELSLVIDQQMLSHNCQIISLLLSLINVCGISVPAGSGEAGSCPCGCGRRRWWSRRWCLLWQWGQSRENCQELRRWTKPAEPRLCPERGNEIQSHMLHICSKIFSYSRWWTSALISAAGFLFTAVYVSCCVSVICAHLYTSVFVREIERFWADKAWGKTFSVCGATDAVFRSFVFLVASVMHVCACVLRG